MKVYINDEKDYTKPRQVVEATLLRENKTTIVVRLPDNSIIKRKKKRTLEEWFQQHPKLLADKNDTSIL